MATKIEDNRLRKVSTTNSVPIWVTEIFSSNPDVNTNELLIEHAKKIAEERKQFDKLPSKPVTPEFARDNVLVRTSPPFERNHETRLDVDGRVAGHGFMMRIKSFNRETNNLFNSKMDESDGKTFLPFRLINQKLKNSEIVDWSYCSDLENWKLLEDNRVLFKDENVPYEVQPSPEFVKRQKQELADYQRKAQHEQVAREQENEQVRLLGIQLNKEDGERRAREIIQKQKEAEKLELEKQNSPQLKVSSPEAPGEPLNQNEN